MAASSFPVRSSLFSPSPLLLTNFTVFLPLSAPVVSALTAYVDKQVLVITQDGRVIVGELKGFDQTTNVILSGSVERVFSADEGVEEVPLGVYIVRGDNITLIGEVDKEADEAIDLSTVRVDPIGELTH
ncbi:hypothetical protein JCM8547_004166 [Rhodosporidiobolus lusitaniae]